MFTNTTTHTTTLAGLPHDRHSRRYRYWPSPRQTPRLETRL